MRQARPLLFILLAAASILLATPGCGDDLGDCPDDSAAQQTQGLAVLQTRCTTCHGSQVSGMARLGAPPDLSFDDPGTVAEEADAMWEEIDEGTMPPNATLGAGEKEALRVYLACSAE
jgi:mono/diheme cytochrome c family protein